MSLHSELIAVTSDGYIQQWLWEESFPFSQNNDGGHNHKRAVDMNLTNDDKVTKIAAQNIRVSILTESGKVRSISAVNSVSCRSMNGTYVNYGIILHSMIKSRRHKI